MIFPVAKYQHEDAKRKIIRLEQCAQSSMQRALASKGTLAVLYDHHVKHYIKKTEVCFSNFDVAINTCICPLETLLQPLPTM